ncbi:MAG TPA: protein translocase subunit SecD, partial [Gammaproteobacteria bacterium]|nr:protein translocase subunit SecD [Gammaproteobacteria bacterium]
PALQVTATGDAQVDTDTRDTVLEALRKAELPHKAIERTDSGLLVRFPTTDPQLEAKDVIGGALGRDYTVALNLAPATPDWLTGMGALPMYLGLDLRGGVHFLLQVDMEAALQQAIKRYVGDIRTILRDERIRYLTITEEDDQVAVQLRNPEDRATAIEVIEDEYRDLVLEEAERDGAPYLLASLEEKQRREIQDFAVQQNITTLRNRVNELGVAEPVIQRQGADRIVVQLPGVQDTARAKDILGATATLEYHLVDEEHDVQEALSGRVPVGSEIFRDRQGQPILLNKRVIITGDQITDASSGLDQQSGSPAVYVTLDGQGASRMSDTTRENIGKRMAVVFIEDKTTTRTVDGEVVRETERVEEVISVAVIRDHFSKRFQTTGLDSTEEAHRLALLLRAGALAAPVHIVEERTIGPSMGQDNIDQGFMSVVIGFVLVLAFMAVWYKGFGLVANLALGLNLVLIVAVLSMLQATLTLPGIAGIVLTVGMAVDANVLIFERIREELKNGNTPQASIHAGYEKALSTIADANITTLIAAVVLFTFGTGPIKGFAITLSIGIMTSMFTAIMGTRAVVNLAWGGRRLKRLSI